MEQVSNDMKANELMIGDWIYRPDCYDTVTEIRKNSILGSDHLRGTLPFTQIEPIPLTKEILKANGWDVKDSCYAWYKIDESISLCFYWYEHRLTRIYKGVDEWQNNANVREEINRINGLYYVHIFQHALRLCGLTELADHLKIE